MSASCKTLQGSFTFHATHLHVSPGFEVQLLVKYCLIAHFVRPTHSIKPKEIEMSRCNSQIHDELIKCPISYQNDS